MEKKKRGALSKIEEEYIIEHRDEKTPEEIAADINRTSEPVLRFMNRQYLKHKGMSEDDEVFIQYKKRLSTRPYYMEVLNILQSDELPYFVQMWVEFVDQFRGDIQSTEEMQLKDYLIFDILKNRSLKDQRDHLDQLSEAKQELDKLYKAPEGKRDIGRINSLEQNISFLRNSIGVYNTTLDKLSNDSQKILKDLKATRDQRIKTIESGHETWSKYLRMLEDEDIREREGKEIELMRLAKEKVKKQLNEWHQYIDSTMDLPVLNVETYQKRIEEDRKLKDSE